MSTIYAQSSIDRIVSRFVLPLVAAVVVLASSESVESALIILIAMVLVDAGAGARMRRYPLHLVPLARYVLSTLIPAGAIAIAVLLSHLGHSAIGIGTALITLLVLSLVSVAGLALGNRLASRRPIRTAVIGRGHFAERLRSELKENRIGFFEVVGYVDDVAADPGSAGELPRLGEIDEIRSVVQQNRIDLLVVGPEKPRMRIFEQIAKACLDLPVRMIEATALYEHVLGHVPIGAINSAWFQYILHPLYSPSSPLSKRVLDVAVSSVLLVIAGPLMIVCALAIKLTDWGPVFYRQPRFGEEGRGFDMVKFRTLRSDADKLLAEGRAEQQLVTPVGRVLRKAHLNELPQLLEVLRGEMSLVGPRPEPPELVETLTWTVPHYDRRALVKPGLTGWAQVRCGYAGSHIGSAWKTCHDLYYIKHRSVLFDLVILLQTFRALVESEESDQMPAPDFILGDSDELVAR